MNSSYNIDLICKEIHNTFPPYKGKPTIGITGNFNEGNCTVADGYIRSVLAAGGTPLIIPPYEERDALLSTLNRIDGLLLTGGGDINPLFLGEVPV